MFQPWVLPGGLEVIWKSKLDVGDKEKIFNTHPKKQESIGTEVSNSFFVNDIDNDG